MRKLMVDSTARTNFDPDPMLDAQFAWQARRPDVIMALH